MSLNNISTITVALVVALVLCGCASNELSVTSGISSIDKKTIASRSVELPSGYDVDDFRRLPMGVNGGRIQSNTPAFKKQDVEDYMNLRFQSEMDKHKRFKFLALWGGGTQTLDALKDIGEIASDDEVDGQAVKDPALSLNWNINIQEKRMPVGGHAQKFQWFCTVNVTVKYTRDVKEKGSEKVKFNKGFVAFTRDFDLPVIEKTQELNSMGGVRSGFNYKSDADVQSLMQEIVIAASQRIADDLGRQFPVGGNIIGALGEDLMTMDKGALQGVEPDMEMVIIARYDGVDVALGNATAKPQQDKTTLRVWRFSRDKYARAILAEINGDPKRWVKETGNRLFAVRAVPAQDESRGTRFDGN